MAVFALLVKYILLVVIFIMVFVAGVVAYFMHRVRSVTQQFRQASGQGANGQRTYRHGANSQRANSQRDSAGSTDSGSDSRGGSGGVAEELYDERSPREANRKIFAKDEGEYVDFEEV